MGTNERTKIQMTDDEIAEFIDHSRTATMATVSPGGRPHLVAMWYALLDGEIWFETKAKSQKAVNLRRDPTMTVMIEDGDTYGTLRGVAIDCRAEIVDDDPDAVCACRHQRLGALHRSRTPRICSRSSTR